MAGFTFFLKIFRINIIPQRPKHVTTKLLYLWLNICHYVIKNQKGSIGIIFDKNRL